MSTTWCGLASAGCSRHISPLSRSRVRNQYAHTHRSHSCHWQLLRLRSKVERSPHHIVNNQINVRTIDTLDMRLRYFRTPGKEVVILSSRQNDAKNASSMWFWGCQFWLGVPVNYAIRFSGPVTTLTARRVWYGVGTRSVWQVIIVGSGLRPSVGESKLSR